MGSWVESFGEVIGCRARMEVSKGDGDATDDFLA